jgi:hypothetical protein
MNPAGLSSIQRNATQATPLAPNGLPDVLSAIHRYFDERHILDSYAVDQPLLASAESPGVGSGQSHERFGFTATWFVGTSPELCLADNRHKIYSRHNEAAK